MLESFKYIGAAVVSSLLTYWFTNRGKRRDIYNQKIKELNTVLSNMLIAWDYLSKLNLTLKFWEDKSDELVFPKEFLPVFLLNSEILNDKCFEDLEKSIENLKQYDSITYHQLEGIGKRIDVIRKTYILPLIRAKIKTDQTIGMSRSFLDKLMIDIEDSLEGVAILVSRKSAKEIKKKIEVKRTIDMEKLIEELNQEYYFYMVNVYPKEFGTVNYEEFKEAFRRPETKQIITEQLDLFVKYDMKNILEKFALNPDISLEELKAEMKLYIKDVPEHSFNKL